MFRPKLEFVLVTMATVALPAGIVIAAEAGLVSAKATVVETAQRPTLALSKRGGRFELPEPAKVQAKLALSAAVAADETAVRIVASTIELKDAQKSPAPVAASLEDGRAVATLSAEQSFIFSVEPGSALALAAASACSSKPVDVPAGQSSEATMTASAVWRVTTGRFNFRWMDYDRVAVARDRAEFYADRETVTRNADVVVTLDCRNDEPKSPEIAQPIAQPAVPRTQTKADAKKEAKAEVKAEPPKSKNKPEPSKIEAAEPGGSSKTTPAAVAPKPADAALAATAAGLTAEPPAADVGTEASTPAPAQKPACAGGMIRETRADAGSYICLCPGNTQRVSSGPNAYACQKR